MLNDGAMAIIFINGQWSMVNDGATVWVAECKPFPSELRLSKIVHALFDTHYKETGAAMGAVDFRRKTSHALPGLQGTQVSGAQEGRGVQREFLGVLR